jgi:hypothetical protein
MKNLLFENVPCPRCGGSGNYSFCQMHGSTCFKCGGSGAVLTKRGRAAQNYLNDLRSVRADQLKPGDEIFDDGVPGFTRGGFGEVIFAGFVDSLNGRVFRVKATNVNWDTVPDHKFRLRRTKAAARELIEKALAYQGTLSKSGKEKKRK